MVIDLKNSINEIVELIDKNHLEKAKIKAIKINPKNDVLYNVLGIIYLKLNEHYEAISNFKNAIEINNNFLSATINLAICFQEIKDTDNAMITYKKILKINPNMHQIYNDIALLHKNKNEIETAIDYLEKCIKIQPDYFNAYFNLGVIYKKINKYKEAIFYLEKTIEIKPDYYDSYFELGEINRKIKNFEIANHYYTKSKNEKTSYKKLQCFYEGGNKESYLEEMRRIIKIEPNNRRIASLATFVSNQLNIKNIYPFCIDPLNFVYQSSLNKYFNNENDFINTLLEELSNIDFKWEPKGRTTVKGFTTNNLTEKNLPTFNRLQKLIFKELDTYYEFYSDKKDNIIKNKPKEYKFISWSNRLKKEGFNLPHIHPSGWISGVFYLKIPSKIKNDEAGIQFHLNGDDFIIKDKNLPVKTIKPEVGDIVLFPSSLFHSTVPFTSSEERVCIAFDLCDLNQN